MNLFEKTYDLVRQIPEGKVSSYGAVADALGDKRASRAVGRIMNQNPDADTMPCYKIVHSDGKLGGFGLGINDKIRRLNQVGIKVNNGKIVNFENVFFKDFKTDFPLKKLAQEQKKLSKKLILKNDFKKIEYVAGLDVAYPNSEFDKACAAGVIYDYKTKKILKQETIYMKTNFPYIASYFAYRELPLLENLINKLDSDSTIFMIDGNGLLHPRKFGLASHVGLKLDVSTIGVTKTKMIGKVKNNHISYDDQLLGYTFYKSKKIKKPIYISPGHKIDHEKSLEIVKNFSKNKIPEPLRIAHFLATECLRSKRRELFA